MAEGSIFTMTGDFPFVDDVTYDLDFDTETKLDGSTHTFLNGSGFLEIPASANGLIGEVFFWMEADFYDSGDDFYLGIKKNTNDEWYGIIRDHGLPSRGWRSGPTVLSTGDEWVPRFRSFGTTHGNMDKDRCRLGILLGPAVPLAVATTDGKAFSGQEWLDGNRKVVPSIVYDPELVHSAGDFVAPAGATSCVVNLTLFTDFHDRMRYYLVKNGTVIRNFQHAVSHRGYAPGCFAIEECSPGDVFHVEINTREDTVLQDMHLSVEFY